MSIIIVMDGAIPPQSFFQQQAADYLIASDGAASKLLKMGLTANLVLGDMDTLKEHSIDKLLPDAKIIKQSCQETTDFEKCLLYLEQNLNHLPIKNPNDILVTGIFGKDLDHTLYNLSLLTCTKLNLAIYHQDQMAIPQWGHLIHAPCTLTPPVGTTLSLYALQRSIISTKGLKWDLTDTTLEVGQMSVRNSTIDNQVHLHLKQGKIICLTKSMDNTTPVY